MNEKERNTLWRMFIREKERKLFVEWERYAQWMLAQFRVIYGRHIDDPWFIQFVEELKAASPEFNLWWPQHDILGNIEGYKVLNHPDVGEMVFECSSFYVSNDSNLRMNVHTPHNGSGTAAKIQWLLDAFSPSNRHPGKGGSAGSLSLSNRDST